MEEIRCLTYHPIDIITAMAGLRSPHTGGMVIFSGEVRILNHGKQVDYLEYEAYEPMAQNLIMQIVNDAKEKWKLNNAYCIHRLGRLEISDCAIIVITCSVHRSEAYMANQYIIDRVKSEVPIWKNEHFTDGTNQWGSNSDCSCATHSHK